MKVSVDFSELQKVLGYSNTILSDKSVEDKYKNVIFLVRPEGVKIAGYSAFTFSRTELSNAVVEDVEDEWKFQLKASDLNKIMSSFSNLSRTKVSTIQFEDEGVRVKVTVHEEPLEDAYASLEQDSKFHLEVAPIVKTIDNDIHREFPEDLDLLSSGDLLVYLDSMFSIMDNTTANGVGSRFNFVEDYVFVINSYMSAFMKNRLPDAFKNLAVTYSSVNFLKKLCEDTTDMGVAKIDNFLCIQTGSTEAFLKYQNVKIPYKMYVDKRSKENGIVLDRLYLKDVLKRMGNVNPEGKVRILEDDTLQVVNSNFDQIIPLIQTKGDVKDINFNVSIPILEKTIIGKDDIFSGNVFMYFVPTARGYMLYMSDNTGAWFSATQLTRA